MVRATERVEGGGEGYGRGGRGGPRRSERSSVETYFEDLNLRCVPHQRLVEAARPVEGALQCRGGGAEDCHEMARAREREESSMGG